LRLLAAPDIASPDVFAAEPLLRRPEAETSDAI
jgi:hypothetical protein